MRAIVAILIGISIFTDTCMAHASPWLISKKFEIQNRTIKLSNNRKQKVVCGRFKKSGTPYQPLLTKIIRGSKYFQINRKAKSEVVQFCYQISHRDIPPATPTMTPTERAQSTLTPTPTPISAITNIPVFRSYRSSTSESGAAFIAADAQFINQIQQLLSQQLASHPRIRVNNEIINRLRNLYQSGDDPTLSSYINRFLLHTTYNIVNPHRAPEVLKIDDALNLNNARTYLSEMEYLGLSYQITGTPIFLARLKEYLLALTDPDSYPNWAFGNGNALHVAGEFAAAAALGYSISYDSLTPTERSQVEEAILNNALIPYISLITNACQDPWSCRAGETLSWSLWSGMNITIVSSAGFQEAALAVADVYPTESAIVIANTLKTLQTGLGSSDHQGAFYHDGGFAEGYSYAIYALNYGIDAIRSLLFSLNTDFDLSNAAGVSNAGDYLIQAGGLKNSSQFGESSGTQRVAALSCLADKFNKPIYASWQQKLLVEKNPPAWTRTEFNDLVCYQKLTNENSSINPPSSAFFREINEAYLSTGWDEHSSFRVGLHGGRNFTNHHQRDLGSFTLNYKSEQFVTDWGYLEDSYPSSTKGHSLITFNDDQNQSTYGTGGVVRFSNHSNDPFAILDLSNANAPLETNWKRGIQIINDNAVVVQDEFDGVSPTRWSIQTTAQVTINGREAMLELNGTRLKMEILFPLTSSFEVQSVSWAGSPQGSKRVLINNTDSSKNQRIVVGFSDPSKDELNDYSIQRLNDWWN